MTTCEIDELIPEQIKLFTPDKLEQAKEEGFTPCPLCLWNEK